MTLAEVEYGGITDDGLLREAVFKGLRDDLTPRVRAPFIRPPRRPHPAREGGRVPHENILQLLPDAIAPTKEELISYWNSVGKRALHYLGSRPLKLVRHTMGTTFYHKGKLPPIPGSVHQLRIRKREGGEGVRLWVDDVEGLLGLVAMDAVELHPWSATIDDIERPDRLVFDLDPGPDVHWDFVIETALSLRDLLERDGFQSFPKLTGGKGAHLMVPIERSINHDRARTLSKQIAERLAVTRPDAYTTSSAPTARRGRIYIDCLRNGRGNTAIGAYSPRVRDGFPVAAPVTWRDIERGILPNHFTMLRPPRQP